MKQFLILFLSLYCDLSFSCHYDVNRLNALMAKPESANLAVLGKIKYEKGKRIFLVEKSWTSHSTTYLFKDGDNCQVPAIENKSYLLLSDITPEGVRSKNFEGFKLDGLLLLDEKDAQEIIKRLDKFKGTKLEFPNFGK